MLAGKVKREQVGSTDTVPDCNVRYSMKKNFPELWEERHVALVNLSGSSLFLCFF